MSPALQLQPVRSRDSAECSITRPLGHLVCPSSYVPQHMRGRHIAGTQDSRSTQKVLVVLHVQPALSLHRFFAQRVWRHSSLPRCTHLFFAQLLLPCRARFDDTWLYLGFRCDLDLARHCVEPSDDPARIARPLICTLSSYKNVFTAIPDHVKHKLILRRPKEGAPACKYDDGQCSSGFQQWIPTEMPFILCHSEVYLCLLPCGDSLVFLSAHGGLSLRPC
jgi:hypothetical protein